MELKNSFTVEVPIGRAWEVLNDVEGIAPCLPGAQLQEVEGEEYRGVVKVKVGPIVTQYKGKATFVERDEAAGRMVLRAEGRETKGQGNASALITAELSAQGERTEVTVTTDLTVTGKVAQFGRGVMAEVSGKLMAQFADNLETKVLAKRDEQLPLDEGSAGGNRTTGANVSGPAPRASFSQPDPEPVDLLGAAGSPLLKRVVPLAIVVIAIAVVIGLILRRRS